MSPALFPFQTTSLALPPPCSLSLSGSLPSVCLCAWGAGCYLDDLVREGERDFISCLPEGLWYLWCYNATLLKKKPHTHTHKHTCQYWCTMAQRVKVHSMHLSVGLTPPSGSAPLGLWYQQHSKDGGFVFQDITAMHIKDWQARVQNGHKADSHTGMVVHTNPQSHLGLE